MEYHFRIYQEDDGYWAECVELPGCMTQADNREDLDVMMGEALELYLDEPITSDMCHPLPEEMATDDKIVCVPVPATVALPLLVRHQRLKNGLSIEQARQRLGFKHRTDYVRLEHKGNPTLQKIVRIKEAWPDFPLEKCFSRPV